VARSGVAPGDLVLDVGAGTGALTAELLAAGATVVAVELHPGRRTELRRRFAGTGLVVVGADAADLRLPRRPFKVVANPPFGAATGLLRRLVAPGSRLVRADLVLPRPLARSWAGPGAPGRGRWGATFAAQLGPAVPRRAFRPPPARDPALLTLARRR
jgi:23S rRNA (adenine-N6)-dimethyltransferase